MNSFIEKFEADPKVRARVVQFVALAMAMAGAVVIGTIGLIVWSG